MLHSSIVAVKVLQQRWAGVALISALAPVQASPHTLPMLQLATAMLQKRKLLECGTATPGEVRRACQA